MTRIYRALVYLVTFAVPVVIAACYGPAYRYRKGGKVLDKVTRDPISQIDVSCTTAAGTAGPSRTGSSGQYTIASDEACLTMTAVDHLGPYDAGVATDAGSSDAGPGERTARYAPMSAAANSPDGVQDLEMDRSN